MTKKLLICTCIYKDTVTKGRDTMSVNGINANSNVYTTTPASTKTNSEAVKTDETKKSEAAAQSSSTTEAAQASKKEDTAAVYDKRKLSEEDRMAIAEQLKLDQEKRQTQLTDLVKDMISKQTNLYGTANDIDIWKFLAKGEFEVDEATRKEAEESISEDGYWGVEQTSNRILEFATSLAGDDEEALEKMRDAFLNGYEKAEETWGGKLPEISKKTYDAVLEKFDSLMKEKDTTTDKTATQTPDTTVTTEDGTVVVKN